MNEKRFTIKAQDDYWGVVDEHSGDRVCVVCGIHTEIEAEWLCNAMNKLQDENEQLRKKLLILTAHLLSDECNLTESQIKNIKRELENV